MFWYMKIGARAHVLHRLNLEGPRIIIYLVTRPWACGWLVNLADTCLNCSLVYETKKLVLHNFDVFFEPADLFWHALVIVSFSLYCSLWSDIFDHLDPELVQSVCLGRAHS
jgi:hypothetical protein